MRPAKKERRAGIRLKLFPLPHPDGSRCFSLRVQGTAPAGPRGAATLVRLRFTRLLVQRKAPAGPRGAATPVRLPEAETASQRDRSHFPRTALAWRPRRGRPLD